LYAQHFMLLMYEPLRRFLRCIVCDTQTDVAAIAVHKNPVACAAFSRCGKLLATASVKVCRILVADVVDCWGGGGKRRMRVVAEKLLFIQPL